MARTYLGVDLGSSAGGLLSIIACPPVAVEHTVESEWVALEAARTGPIARISWECHHGTRAAPTYRYVPKLRDHNPAFVHNVARHVDHDPLPPRWEPTRNERK